MDELFIQEIIRFVHPLFGPLTICQMLDATFEACGILSIPICRGLASTVLIIWLAWIVAQACIIMGCSQGGIVTFAPKKWY